MSHDINTVRDYISMNSSIVEKRKGHIATLQKKGRKVVFAMIEVGGGHKSLALAVHEAVTRLFPRKYELMILDFMRETGCTKLDLKHKQSWDFLLEHPVLCRSGELLTELTGPLFRFGLKYYLSSSYSHTYDFLIDQRPDQVFSTHPFNTIALDQVRKKFGLSFTLINYLTELFDASALWILRDVDYFLVSMEEAKYRLVKRVISEEKLRVFDFPIRNAFFQIRNTDSRNIALKLGFDTEKKTSS
jgi:UDP-N-acetylglucosamine:LPS N-acetylglucosamine transferase